MVVFCENCEKWFCTACDEDGGPCLGCGRNYCGSCWHQDLACCPLPEEE